MVILTPSTQGTTPILKLIAQQTHILTCVIHWSGALDLVFNDVPTVKRRRNNKLDHPSPHHGKAIIILDLSFEDLGEFKLKGVEKEGLSCRIVGLVLLVESLREDSRQDFGVFEI